MPSSGLPASNRNEYQKKKKIWFWEVKRRPEREADNIAFIYEPTV
jgi:hypothetical protein